MLPAPRLLTAVLAAVAGLLVVLVATGLFTGRPVGAADNGDGSRLYCGAGLVPATPDGASNWKSGAVLQFTRDAPCPDPIPTAALPILRAAAHGYVDGWSMTRLGWLYALLCGAVTGVAAWAAAARSLWRVLVLVVPLAPLSDPDFARFFLSTFSEPAGLLGAYTLVCGVGVVAVTARVHRRERLVGLALVAGGGLLAVSAKPAYAPLLGVAALVCVVTAVSVRRREPRWHDRVAGPVFAAVVLLAAVSPVTTALAWQARHYPAVNAHNLIFTTVLTEIPGSAAALGLPPAADARAGEAYYPNGPDGVPGADVIAAQPGAARNTAWRVLVAHPAAFLRAVGVGMQATQGRALDYLPAAPWTPQTVTPHGSPVGEQGASAAVLRGWLGGMAVPWWPSLLAALGVLAGIGGALCRGRLWAGFAQLAGLAALSAVGLAAIAVLGDGYFEIAKHVWLAAYLLDVTLCALLGAVVVGVRGRGGPDGSDARARPGRNAGRSRLRGRESRCRLGASRSPRTRRSGPGRESLGRHRAG
ncbi:MAG TPA: hypothetical protein VIP28_15255 [Nocardioides sp.]